MYLDCFILQFYSSDPEKGSLHFLTLVELALIREVDKGSIALLWHNAKVLALLKVKCKIP